MSGILPRMLGRGGGVLPLAAPGNPLDDNRNAILGYLAGALQGGNLGQSIGRGLAGFVQGAARDAREQALPATYAALTRSGLPAPLAHAAALNPDLLKLVAPEYFGGFKVVQTGEDAFGGKTFKLQGPGGRLYDIPERQAESVASPANAPAGDGYFAPGVTRVDPRLAGEDYLAQFSPAVQAAAKTYVAGEAMPDGDPRKGFAAAVKTIARKYAADVGTSADDTTFARRRQYRDAMRERDPSSAGGRRDAANAALEHLGAVSDLLAELSSQDWFTAYLARGANALESMTADQAGKLNALNGALDRYGAAIAGVHGGQGADGARSRALARFAATAHPREFAAAVEAERDLVHGRLKAMEQARDAVLGPGGGGGGGVEIISAPGARALARIAENIARLRGNAAAPVAAPAAPAGL
jgi:hypothetical protein